MDGKNSTGRRISLLNENEAASITAARPSIIVPPPALHSRTSSYASTPSGFPSPQTPQLVRSDSTDSAVMQTPSPTTPDFYEGLPVPQQTTASPVFSNTPYFSAPKEPLSAYPPVPQNNGPLPYPASSSAPQPAYFRAPGPERQPMPPANPKTKKNSYPCPMAKQFNCNDFFTTSGHAARHAKKHTGKKDAFCPVCNKAFTRKDNMEQHRRTHQNGRNSAKNSDESRAKKAKTQSKRPKPAPLQASMTAVDPALPLSPASSFGMAPAVQPVTQAYSPPEYHMQSPYPDPLQYSHHSTSFSAERYDLMPSPLYALDALAIAASGEKRKYEG